MTVASVKFYGTRGSIPVCDPGFQEFGGDTTCIAIHRKKEDTISIFDAGTGIRYLGRDIIENFPDQNELIIVFSHFHWDHIQGFPFFEPAYNPDLIISIFAMGKNQRFTNLREIFSMPMQDIYFPVVLEKMGANFNFLLIENERIKYRNANIQTILQNHPGGSYGYRMEAEGKSIVICTDLEHGDSINEDIVEFAKEADLLVHEAQYTNEELATHKGWGHSSFEQAIEVAERANVKRLVMTHHDPDHDDDFLERIEKKCQKRFSDCELARTGLVVDV